MLSKFAVALTLVSAVAASNNVGVKTGKKSFLVNPIAIKNDGFDSYAQYSRNVSGWNYLDVSTVASSSIEDHLSKLKGSGIAEGYLSCEDLQISYPNFFADNFGNEPPPTEFLEFIVDNYLWMIEESDRSSSESNYWLTVKSMLSQLHGVYEGYLSSPCVVSQDSSEFSIDDKPFTQYANRETLLSIDVTSGDKLTLLHLLLLNSWGDIYSITSKYDTLKKMKGPVRGDPEDTSLLTEDYVLNRKRISYPKSSSGSNHEIQRDLRCSSLFKILPDYSDIFFGHATWGSYIALAPRIFKRYELPVATYADSTHSDLTVEIRVNSFSSSPGLLASLDDFYIVSSPTSDLVVIETTNDMLNPSLHALITPQHNLCWMRVLVANALATSGETWSVNFGYLNSGTYTNQWQVMDLSLFEPGRAPTAPGFFTLLEEVPGTVVYRDVTPLLNKMTYWGSYNVPFFPEISFRSGNEKACEVYSTHQNDTDYCWINAPRASIFRQRHADVRTLADFQSLINFNDWQHDPLSAGDACKSIACRRDLETDPALVYPSGGLDAKVSSYSMSRTLGSPRIVIRNGPTTDNQIPFCWSSLNETYVHNGQPDCFDYSWLNIPLDV